MTSIADPESVRALRDAVQRIADDIDEACSEPGASNDVNAYVRGVERELREAVRDYDRAVDLAALSVARIPAIPLSQEDEALVGVLVRHARWMLGGDLPAQEPRRSLSQPDACAVCGKPGLDLGETAHPECRERGSK